MEEAGFSATTDTRIFVAVGMESRKSVEWAAKKAAKLGGNRIVLLHVFQPRPRDRLSRAEYMEKTNEILRQYGAICAREKVETEKIVIEMDGIEKGILEQVSERGIRKLVMGAATDKHYSREMESNAKHASVDSKSVLMTPSQGPSPSGVESGRILQSTAASEAFGSADNERLSAGENFLMTLQRKYDELLRERNDLRQRRDKEAASSSQSPLDFQELPFDLLKEATNNFDSEKKIREGEYGKVYKCLLRHTPVTINMLDPQNLHGCSEFKQEVKVLSMVRHPNLVTLIGTCSEQWALVCEYLPNGSLEDRLRCKDNTPSLSWQTRTRIAFDVCVALNFLHSYPTHSIVHGDLKPANILLDSNFVAKLGDFGISRLILRDDSESTLRLRTKPKGTLPYIDPEFMSTGELTEKSDVYAFGIVLLQLLTGKPPKGLKDAVEEALNKDSLHMILDETAKGWPLIQAKELARKALKCCELDRRNRPDLANTVWKFLKRLVSLAGRSVSSSQPSSNDADNIPSYFVCPISLEIMRDPHFAADGFTYEAEAIRGWLNDHNTSPVTNIRLPHTELTPNRALKTTIEEWAQQP